MNTKKKINSLSQQKRVLVSPLDWGLGHAVRCIPVITELLFHKCEVFIAAEGAAFFLLKTEFPKVNFLPLAGYRIRLSKYKSSLSWKIFIQLPKIMYTIYKEKQWLKKIIKEYKINAVISDNRVGLYNKKITSVYITHQLLIKTGNKFTSKIAQFIHNYFIKKYDECWVPDFEKDSLAGELSHPKVVPQNVKYIGALSRFDKKDHVKKKYDLLIVISGPEPQRTMFEKLLLNDLLFYNGKALLIRGLPGNSQTLEYKRTSVEIVNHLSANKLCEAIQQADVIICRSGYTTIMDLVKLNKRAILVPTPGQAEQEYLGRYLTEKKMFLSTKQKPFNLIASLEQFSGFQTAIHLPDMKQYKLAIEKLLQSIRLS
ncbi:MAG: glycosyltransferase [Ginsengibacter sp.]